MNLGCHAVLFKEKIKTETENTIKLLSSTGFAGSEIGSRFFGTDDKEYLLNILNTYNYQITGMHIGLPIEDWASNGEEAIDKILKVADFMKDMPNKNVMMSTKRFSGSEEELIKAAKNIDVAAKKCKEMGVKLNLHNHIWEFENDGFIFKTLVEYAPNLYLGLDLGWVYAGGFDPIEVVENYADRISYVHLRDIDENKEFVDLGEGIIDYTKLIKALKKTLGEDGWAVVEYEHGEQDINRYIRAYEFLQKFM
ncbi:myo-inosose-2 dehydratase [Vallitalea longa]|uniref:Myo-inosose-2 dehydratase n=1 Tax=Vallitalea longa TaxID=2936439 RepID=A0A9W5YA85_9FIRM|nr:sugar phosphate isomerase/epimerase [Vallitalea longa]GKX27583.1 myo-inosose-2 dehydratase [Vallitalea longa]